MYAAIGTTHCSPHWSVRKLLICFTIWRHPEKTAYLITDFVYPVRYPRSIRTEMWEVIQTHQCLHTLQDEGIEITSVKLDPLYRILTGSKVSMSAIRRNLRQLKSKPFIREANDKHITPESEARNYVVPRFLTFKIKVNRTLLNTRLRSYCLDFFKCGSYGCYHFFGKPFAKQLFERFFKTMQHRQGSRFHFNMGALVEEDYAISDEFVDIFKRRFEYEYTLWNEGVYEFPFFQYLISSHINQSLALDRIAVRIDDISQFENGAVDLGWLGLDRVPLLSSLTITIPGKKHKPAPSNGPITSIEVVPTEQDQYVVYVNKQHQRPMLLSKKKLSGALIYELATNGYAPMNKYRKAFEYIKRDRRFKLFAQSGAIFSRILQNDEAGAIIPNRIEITLQD